MQLYRYLSRPATNARCALEQIVRPRPRVHLFATRTATLTQYCVSKVIAAPHLTELPRQGMELAVAVAGDRVFPEPPLCQEGLQSLPSIIFLTGLRKTCLTSPYA